MQRLTSTTFEDLHFHHRVKSGANRQAAVLLYRSQKPEAVIMSFWDAFTGRSRSKTTLPDSSSPPAPNTQSTSDTTTLLDPASLKSEEAFEGAIRTFESYLLFLDDEGRAKLLDNLLDLVNGFEFIIAGEILVSLHVSSKFIAISSG